MNIVFMGTSVFAVAALRALATTDATATAATAAAPGDAPNPQAAPSPQAAPNPQATPNPQAAPTAPGDTSFDVKLVFTRPVAAGRGKALAPSPVQACAQELGIPTITPTSFFLPRDPHDAVRTGPANSRYAYTFIRPPTLDPLLINLITAAQPDFIVVAAYGLLLPFQILDLPRYGSINIHGSLLPRWRGAAPIQRAILAGDPTTGVCITRMEPRLDTGPVCSCATTPLPGKNTLQLTQELAQTGAQLLISALPQIANGTATWQPQPRKGVLYADKIKKSQLDLSPTLSVEDNIRRVLASSPQTPARCMIGNQAVTILAAQPVAQPANQATSPAYNLPPATVLYHNKQLFFATSNGCFAVTSLKPQGKKTMEAPAFAAGHKDLQKTSQTPLTWSAIRRKTS